MLKKCFPRISIREYRTHLELRKSFFEYFASKNHEIRKSSSVIPPENDGTLLFTNAGMNQFKAEILNPRFTEKKRIANIQKCIRAGGKHNDLDDVGRDVHHQTFFEMMGNWSFNDAFSKKESCQFAWDFLVNTLRIDADRLYVSYFGGLENQNLPEDVECREIWRELGLPADKILPFISENFWEMGATGPCGPSTEIHFDRIGNRNASNLVNLDDSVVEIWNLVFMGNLRDAEGKIGSLGRRHIDTGMGLERLLSIIQGTDSNFDTDLFRPILGKIGELTSGGLKYNEDPRRIRENSAFRLIADHVRAASIAISDGAIPDGTGNGFVVRKMMRRSFLQGNSKLGIERFALGELVPTVVDSLKSVYPELESSSKTIQRIFNEEESQFWKQVDKAKKVFDKIAEENENLKNSKISGKQAFHLFETFGLPLEITNELARNIGKIVDEEEFEKCQKEAQKVSQKASQFFKFPISADEFPSHSDRAKYFYEYRDGKYEFPKVKTRVLGVYKDQQKVERLVENEKGFLVLEDCQFYAEQGGQTNDTGRLMIDETSIFEVENAKKVAGGGVTVLFGRAIGEIESGLVVEQNLDESKREGVMRAHSATHLLNWELQRARIGTGQRGSAVYSDRLRFDYSTSDDVLTKDQRMEILKNCENSMNSFIKMGGATEILETTVEEAKKIENLQSDVKEERIGASTVRVVSLGRGAHVPIECCSGTHVANVEHIGEVTILSDKSTGQRLRRIIAVTGKEAENCRKYSENLIEQLESTTDSKERNVLVKKIDWKQVPLVSQHRISELVKKLKNSK